jgi:single-strand DNA-binding protein
MRGVNKVILIGNATRDAELHHTQSGKPVANLRLATNRAVKTSTGELRETTQFHTVVCWDKLAETTSTYVTKGKPLYIEGRLDYREYTDSEGQTRRTTEIVASEVQFLGDRGATTDDGTVPDTAPTEEVALEDIPF